MREQEPEKTQRIAFIDLAKGVCILLVIIGHCGLNNYIRGLDLVRLPLYFALSGLFFKSYAGPVDLLRRKTNKILIPFLFFYVLSYAIFYTLEFLGYNQLTLYCHGLGDIFQQRHLYNNAIWFLLCLFWCNIIFATIHYCLPKAWQRLLATALLGALGLWLGQNNISLPLYFDISCSSLPFFAFGYYLKQSEILSASNIDRYTILPAIVLYGLCYELSGNGPYHLSFYCNDMSGILIAYPLALLSVLCVLLACKSIKTLPIISYIGHYSIIILCTHQLINNPLFFLSEQDPYNYLLQPHARFLITLCGSILLIPFCTKFLPYFCARKDLLPITKRSKTN